MKLILSLTLLWTLSSTAGALQCQTCGDETCSSTVPVTCSTETMCITATVSVTSFGTTVQEVFKGCALSSLCPATGPRTFSVSLGDSSALASASCCNTDNCNNQTLAFPATPANNSLQCNSCTTSQCTTPLQCRGTEDRCFQATLTSGSTTTPAFGCASANLCLPAASLASLPFIANVGTISSGPVCCETSLCNVLTTTPAPTTTTTAPTTTTTAAPTTTTTTAATTTTTTTSGACCFKLGVIHLLLGLLLFILH